MATEVNSARARLADDLARVGAGDRAALKRVFDATSAKLFGVCRRILPDGTAAEDALQDAYIKVWKNAARFDATRASPITWLCAIARNTALDAVRANGRGEVGHDALVGQAAVEAMPAMAVDTSPDVQSLARCLDQLEANQRGVIVAAFYDGFSYSELATARNVPLGTMKSWIRRGLALLKGCLDDE
jgi:RNA polymerase sigma-70 factor (ECF subfamily)